MHILTVDELRFQPQRLIDDAQRGEASIVTLAGEPVMLAMPLGRGVDSRGHLLELAATLFDRENISLGLAARIAGLSISEMIDELGRREISVIRLSPGELDRELAAFGGIPEIRRADRRLRDRTRLGGRFGRHGGWGPSR